ncbi:MAG TPA: cation:proton antiporter [Baekduia sp.]|nr:cation:proton antiporter [Baekduia sp.]
MSSDDILLGIGLVTVLGVGGQVAARAVRLPGIVVLLPLGFVAGVLTDDVHPDRLLGALYQPFVSVAVGVILLEAGLRLSVREVDRRARRGVARLVLVGVAVTWAAVTAAVALLFGGMDVGVALVLGAILVVSGPTVVLPLLAFVRPARRIRTLLMWEGILVDPVGALLGATVFSVVLAGGGSWRPGAMLASVAVGAAVGLVAALALLLLLPWVQANAPRQVVPVVLAVAVGALVGADLLRDDAGFVATTLLGGVLANQRRVDVSQAMLFQASLVQLLIGVLFVLIAASVSPSDVRDVLPEAAILVVLMVLVIRPLAVALATWRTASTVRERAFAAAMAPRGIVAGATASAFGLQLSAAGLAGADRVLPIAFVAILGTVLVSGLGAAPLARALGVAGGGGALVLVVGGNAWARAVASALAAAGVRVQVWCGTPEEQRAAHDAGLPAGRGGLMLGALTREAELEEVTDALVLTANDDVNALAAAALRDELGRGHVFRLAPEPARGDLERPEDESDVLGTTALTWTEVRRRLERGARVVEDGGPGRTRAGVTPLVVVTRSGDVRIVARRAHPPAGPGDRVIGLEAAPSRVGHPLTTAR